MTLAAPAAVLDTNTVLDWLVFDDPHAALLGARVAAGTLCWQASPAMRTEFDHVIGRAELLRWQPDRAGARAAWERHARIAAAEPPAGPLRCTDPDDQVFIDLALHLHCRWLLTRDRALLRLARRARAWGIEILTPLAWAGQQAMSVHTDDANRA
jgi:predicted nucleic acid-binding protein